MLRIKLAILDLDVEYLDRLQQMASGKWNDRIELYVFSDLEVAISSIKANKINVFLSDQNFSIVTDELPEHCAFAYLSDSNEVETYRGIPVVGKYQKSELIMKHILKLYADKADGAIGYRHRTDGTGVIYSFSSASGGAGASTAAAAFAINQAQKGKRTLYLNFEQIASTNCYFNADGHENLGDVLFAIKSNRPNVEVRIESIIKRDVSGVMFFDPFRVALDANELTFENINSLIEVLVRAKMFEVCVVDYNFSFNDAIYNIIRQSDVAVLLTSNHEQSISKLKILIDALAVYQQNQECDMLGKIRLIVNGTNSNQSQYLDERIHTVGVISNYSSKDSKQMIMELANETIWNNLL